MKDFKFFREERYIMSGAGIRVPASTPIGILKGYVDNTLVYNHVVPYRVIINGITYESEIVHMSYNEYVELVNNRTMDVRLCGICLVTDVIDGHRVYETWNGIDDQIAEYPSEFINSPNDSFFIEIIKLPR